MILLKRCCYWVLYAYLVNGIVAYHFNSDNVTLYNESVGSYFGYTVALRSHRKSSTIIVGAPKADFKNSSGSVVKTAGNIFNCDIDTPAPRCETWKFTRSNVAATNAWMGGSLAIENSKDLVCMLTYTHLVHSYVQL